MRNFHTITPILALGAMVALAKRKANRPCVS